MAIRLFRRKEEGEKRVKTPEGMWIKCGACLEIIYKPEVERNLNVCPKCNYHFRIPALERIRSVVDEGTFQEFGEDLESVDMLVFTDTKKYADRLKEAKKKTGRREAVITGTARINGIEFILGVLDFEFLGGSMGCVVGGEIAVAASFAMLGDIIISEPGALIGFAGPRVIEKTIKQKLPEGFQRAEFLLEHGMVDMIVERTKLKPPLTQILRFLEPLTGK